MKTLIIASFLFFGFQLVKAQTPQHPIDKRIDECISSKPSTFAIIECHVSGYSQWETEMTKLYNELLGKLNPNEKLILKEQQLAWKKNSDLEIEFSEKFYGSKGNKWLTIIASNKTDLMRQRALQFAEYLKVIVK